MKNKFKVGDVVRLKSGGPSMTVKDAESSPGTVECVWFAGGIIQSAYFVPDVLKVDNPV